MQKHAMDNPPVKTDEPQTDIQGKRPARFLLAMPEEVRLALQQAAEASGRSLTAEINTRLKASLASQPKPLTTYSTQSQTQAMVANDALLTDHDRALVAIFRKLPIDKQLGLLTLLS